MQYKKTTKKFNAECAQYINDRLSQIIHAIDYWADLSIKYLMYINAGGAIVVLAFMATSHSMRSIISSKLSLLSFIFGIVVVAVVLAVGFYRMVYCLKSLQEDSDKYLTNKIDWDTLLEHDAKRLRPSKWGVLFGWVAFMFFSLGVILGIISLFTYK
jgi:hypothetical protein